MLIQDATRLMREVCALKRLSINTENTYIHWLGRYASFLRDPKLKSLTAEKKMEAFLTPSIIFGRALDPRNPSADWWRQGQCTATDLDRVPPADRQALVPSTRWSGGLAPTPIHRPFVRSWPDDSYAHQRNQP